MSGLGNESGDENPAPEFAPLFPSTDGSATPNSEGPEIKISSVIAIFDFAGKKTSVEVFTMTLGDETIQLLPQKNWTQLDRYKWSAQGKLPGQPSGLDIGLDQVHFAGQTLSPGEPEAREKLERLLNDWLLAQRETTRKKAATQLPVTAPEPPPQPDPSALCFKVEVDKRNQVHIHCIQDNQKLASIGLTTPGINSLVQQGFMRKPQTLHIGVLHDWVKLDGDLCSFENGRNDASRLEQILNERYLPSHNSSRGKEILVLVNAASATGFDIQFPAVVGGLTGNHRYHLDEHSLELLQDKQRCGVLHPEILIKLIAPNLIFKRRTSEGPEGGEQYLASHPDNIVVLTDEDGRHKQIDLSQPVNFLHITAPELTAIFNHPGIRRDSKNFRARQTSSVDAKPIASSRTSPAVSKSEAAPKGPCLENQSAQAPIGIAASDTKPDSGCVSPSTDQPKQVGVESSLGTKTSSLPSAVNKSRHTPSQTPKILPNLWLKDLLSKSPLRHEWLAPLAYRKMARHFDNSSEGAFGAVPCWFISLNGTTDINHPAFNGIFLTEKGGLGFLNKGQIARFNNGAGFLGKVESTHEAIGVDLVALGVNGRNQVAFILADNYRSKFELSEQTLTEQLKQLNESGAVIMSISEMLDDRDPLKLIWTLPVEQADPDNPQVLELKAPDNHSREN